METKPARRVARKGAVLIKALCDEDCDLSAKASIVLKGRGGASSSKRGRKGRVLRALPVSVRLQLGSKARLKLDLSKRRTKRLRKALAGGRQGGGEDRGLGDRGRGWHRHGQAQGEAEALANRG